MYMTSKQLVFSNYYFFFQKKKIISPLHTDVSDNQLMIQWLQFPEVLIHYKIIHSIFFLSQ
jgi:hypothetical protein